MAQMAAEAALLRDEGLTFREIAAELEISVSYARALVADPDGQATWERKHQGVCVDCGGPVYTGTRRYSCMRCRACAKAHAESQRVWTQEAIITAIQRWAELYGRPPISSSWNAAHPIRTPEDKAHYRQGDWPSTTVVLTRFGSWAAARRAAGYPVTHGNAGKRRGRVSTRDLRRLVKLRESGMAFREAGERFGISAGAAQQRYYRAKGKGI
jgi:hypothetical protein